MTCPDLDELHSGTIHLSVPLVDDVIQIGIGGDPAVGAIQVTKTPTTLRVSRVDGRPIQAQLLHYPELDATPVVRTTVFDEPVRDLELQRVGHDSGPWIGTTPLRRERHPGVGQFVRTIATFGLAKQRRQEGLPLR